MFFVDFAQKSERRLKSQLKSLKIKIKNTVALRAKVCYTLKGVICKARNCHGGKVYKPHISD